MSGIIQFISDVLAMLNTPEGKKVVADLEAVAGITPPTGPTPPFIAPGATSPTPPHPR